MAKEITFANQQRAREVAKEMNPNYVWLQNNQTRGTTYYKWLFSKDAVYITFAHGEGNKNGRFTEFFLIKGSAVKVGRDEDDLGFYNEKVKVKQNKK